MTNSRMKTPFRTKCIAYGALSHVFNIIAAFCFANNLHLFCVFFFLLQSFIRYYGMDLLSTDDNAGVIFFSLHFRIAIQTGELLFI